VNGSKDWSTGYSCVLVQFKGSDTVFPLFLSYLLTRNEWPTLNPLFLQVYNGVHHALVHILDYFEFFDASGNTTLVPTHLEEQDFMHLNFVHIEIVKILLVSLLPLLSSLIPACNAAMVTCSQTKQLSASTEASSLVPNSDELSKAPCQNDNANICDVSSTKSTFFVVLVGSAP
jgi:hypothetical protein